jgi:hypothetical protein
MDEPLASSEASIFQKINFSPFASADQFRYTWTLDKKPI